MNSFEQARAAVEGVEGWMTDAQARRLWDGARRVNAPGQIVEIGSFRGRSAIVLALGAAPGVGVVAIDPHGGGDRGPQEITPDARKGEADFLAFNANLARAGVAERIRHLRDFSDGALDAVVGTIELLYVDGAHRYAPARADIERWGARVSDDGTLLIHDSFNAVGVMAAQLRLLFFSRRWRYIGRSGSLAEYRRETLAAPAVPANVLRQVFGLPYFLRNGLVKVLLILHLGGLTRPLGHKSGDWPY